MNNSHHTPHDWEAILARLRRPDVEADPEEILRARARALAEARPAVLLDETAQLEMLVFTLGGERYAFATSQVVHVLPATPITRLAGLPGHVAGIVGVEGEVWPLIDLRSFLSLPLGRLAEPAAFVLVRSGDSEAGFLAESIAGVERCAGEAMQPPFPHLSAAARAALSGISPNRTALFDADRLLQLPHLARNGRSGSPEE
ncbi:MAG TPA: chemotaxis protein CheW [Telluria sp.]|nr:chemotaxis protein CheW [Telluria sp.]